MVTARFPRLIRDKARTNGLLNVVPRIRRLRPLLSKRPNLVETLDTRDEHPTRFLRVRSRRTRPESLFTVGKSPMPRSLFLKVAIEQAPKSSWINRSYLELRSFLSLCLSPYTEIERAKIKIVLDTTVAWVVVEKRRKK